MNIQADIKCIDCKNKCPEYYGNGVSDKAYYEWTLKEERCGSEDTVGPGEIDDMMYACNIGEWGND